MSDTVIKVENLSKAYRIGLKENRNETLVGTIWDFVSTPVKNFRNIRKLSRVNQNHISDNETDIIWALKNVNLEVKRGEVLGIIGPNGAGKSTLLKILSRITHPTSGRFSVKGRIGALLEIGTGMHPELTGRENIYLNGTILGMTKAEIDKKFDEIVEFSGIEKFIDTPVKRYSSGMRVRLGFAIAAHLDTEILIVDEVLAVGDVNFQKKSLGKMESVSKSGRTVLFVSHNMGAIESLCTRAILLHEGKIIKNGHPQEVISKYLESMEIKQSLKSRSIKNKPIYIKDVQICGNDDCTSSSIPFGSTLTLKVFIHTENVRFRPWLGVRITDQFGTTLAYSGNVEWGQDLPYIDSPISITVRIHSLNLIPDTYKIDIRLADYNGAVLDEIKGVGTFTIYPANYAQRLNRHYGIVAFPAEWEIDNDKNQKT